MKFSALFLVPLCLFLSKIDASIHAQSNEWLVDTLITELIKTTGLPSFSLAILEKDSIVFAKAYGYADVGKEIPTNPLNAIQVGFCFKIINSDCGWSFKWDRPLSNGGQNQSPENVYFGA